MRPKFSIRYKFLGVISFLLLLCIVSYLSLALYTFKRDKTELVFDLNRSLVSGISNEVESSFRSIKDKLELFALATEGNQIIANLLQNDPNLVYMLSMNRTLKGKKREFTKGVFLETYGLPSNFFQEEVLKKKPIPVDEILEKGIVIWSVSNKDLPPLIGIGKAVINEGADHTPQQQYAVVAFVLAHPLLSASAHLKSNEVYITTSDGELLIHNHVQEPPENSVVKTWPLVQTALQSQLSTQVLTYTDQNQKRMGAFSRTKDGQLIVYTTIEEDHAFAALTSFVKRSLLFASIIATVALIAAILFSRSLTQPLQILVEGMSRVTAGSLETQIEVHSNDETSVLAKTFNTMIKELQESRHQLEEINRDLEKKVRERTVQLEERNLAVKEAQEALLKTTRLASVGEIAARAAHEVLNPLTGMMTRLNIVCKRTEVAPEAETQLMKDIISAWLQDYKKGGFDLLIDNWKAPSHVNPEMNLFEEDMGNLQGIQKNFIQHENQILEDAQFLLSEAQRIGKIVQNMRSLSTVRSQKEKHSLHRLLQDSVKIMGDLLYQKNITAMMNFNITKDAIYADRDEFIQSVTNILRNAIQAIEAKGEGSDHQIHITTSNLGGTLAVDFRDNGVGIEKDFQPRLFENQFSTKPKEEGTGLGLSISRRFIRAIGGDIFLLHSNAGEETIFRMTLPSCESIDKGVAA